MTEGELLEDLADAIVTGRPVDWDRAEASSSPDVRALLRELRVVAGIADLHREAYRGAPVLRPVTFSQSGERLPPEDSWGPLRLIEPVGDGAAGRVYRAWDTRLDREVALKLIRTRHLGSAATVLHEGRLLARLRHPNIVTVYGVEEYRRPCGALDGVRRGTDPRDHRSGTWSSSSRPKRSGSASTYAERCRPFMTRDSCIATSRPRTSCAIDPAASC